MPRNGVFEELVVYCTNKEFLYLRKSFSSFKHYAGAEDCAGYLKGRADVVRCSYVVPVT
ncbi:3690_t:CDS:2 [Paraglomus brasilianum]|uniref:3690_t:CDS:1 n=1 Tax=Paraglomus brasilianum TaxID=144538 RepID=A0A9N9CFV7_9GLOM|nr:3690_t:CDS:2 [Paraglomus brasilianum]